MDKETIYIIIFIVLGALGLTKLAEWFFINVLTSIGEIVNILEWMSTLNDATPMGMIFSFLLMMAPLVILALVGNYIKERFDI